MRISFPLSPNRSAAWLVSFFSPTLYFILLLISEQLEINLLSEKLMVLFLCLIPVVALLICEFLVWETSRDGVRRRGWMWFTMFGLAFQFGIIIAIVVTAIDLV